MSIELSLICPMYKVAKYIPDLMESLLAGVNTEKVEIIFVDDCCPERSIEICEKFLKDNASEIRFNVVIRKLSVNAGLSGARNEGIKVSSGEYIGYIDSDDAIAPNYWSTLDPYIKSAKYDIIEFNFKEFTDTLPTSIEANVIESAASNIDSFHNGFFVWTRIYKKNNVKNIMFPEGLIYEDIFYNIYVFATANEIIRLSSCLIYYRKSDGSITATRTAQYSQLLINLITATEKNIEKMPNKIEFISLLKERTLISMLKGMKITSKKERKIYYQLCFPKLMDVNKLSKQYGSTFKSTISYYLACSLCRVLK